MDTFQTWTFAIIDVAFSLTFSDDGREGGSGWGEGWGAVRAGGKKEAGSGVIHFSLYQMWDLVGAKHDSPHKPL